VHADAGRRDEAEGVQGRPQGAWRGEVRQGEVDGAY
jgi:hypothetical protein